MEQLESIPVRLAFFEDDTGSGPFEQERLAHRTEGGATCNGDAAELLAKSRKEQAVVTSSGGRAAPPRGWYRRTDEQRGGSAAGRG